MGKSSETTTPPLRNSNLNFNGLQWTGWWFRNSYQNMSYNSNSKSFVGTWDVNSFTPATVVSMPLSLTTMLFFLPPSPKQSCQEVLTWVLQRTCQSQRATS